MRRSKTEQPYSDSENTPSTRHILLFLFSAVFALALTSAIFAPIFGSIFALDANGDGEYQYTQYAVNNSDDSEYVGNLTIDGSSWLVVTFADYEGTVPDEVILYQGEKKIDTDYIDGVEDQSSLSLSGADSGKATVVFVSESGGGFAGSSERTVLARHELRLSTIEKTAKCNRKLVCSRSEELYG